MSLQDILKDQSQHKAVSHGRLVAFTQQHSDHASLARVYLKSQLLALCEAYGNPMSARATKQVLAQALFEAIANNPHVPFTATLDSRIFRVIDRSESDGHIRIRLSRGNLFLILCFPFLRMLTLILFSLSHRDTCIKI